MMFELNINDGSYDRILDVPFERLAEKTDVPASSEAMSADGSSESKRTIFALAQAIMERGYRHRSLRRGSRIL